MRPYDALTDIDKETIKAYLSVYGNTQCGPLPRVLHYWDKNKNTLYKALGGNLRISKMIKVPSDRNRRINELEIIYHPYCINCEPDITFIKNNPEQFKHEVHNEFIADVLIFWANQNYCIEDLSIISRLFLHKNLEKGYISSMDCDFPYHCRDFKCTLKNGMKTLRTIQKVLKATNYNNMSLFEKWSNTINNSLCNEGFKSKLTLSIHPVDFFSMSDNNCNWRSCMAWSNNGSYRSGTLEMMNSNCVVVAYLEAQNPMSINLSEEEVYNIPNKSWRCLFYVHKSILLGGKSYPYHNKDLTICVLDWLRELVKENLNWDYQFINQEYHDLTNLENNFYVRDYWDPNYNIAKPHHKIVLYTNAMYNDLIESKYPHYICCRNKVKNSIKINVSGPVTCICCGEIILRRDEIDDYDSIGSSLVCWDCDDNRRCRCCDKINYNLKYSKLRAVRGGRILGNFCDGDCMHEVWYFKDFDYALPSAKITEKTRVQSYILEYNGDITSHKEIYDIMCEFEDLNTTYYNTSVIDDFIKKYKQRFHIYTLNDHVNGYCLVDIGRRFNSMRRENKVSSGARTYNRSSDLYCFDVTNKYHKELLNYVKKANNRQPLNMFLHIKGGV